MGFRTGAYAKVWEVTPMSDTSTKVRMSISRKNKQSGEYEQDFPVSSLPSERRQQRKLPV